MSDLQYALNDPTTPNLMVSVDLPPPSTLIFSIDGFAGPTQTLWTPEHQAAMCYYSITKAINLANANLPTPITKWAATQRLYVQPRAGKQLNAFYDRTGLKFFYALDPVTNNMVYAVNSTDVVMHETGHAILDALRPDLFNVQSFEVWGFHESFGDMHALMNLLQHDAAMDFLLTETGNNIEQSNTITKLAEEMGAALYHVTGGRTGMNVAFLRNAYNEFTYTEPERLPRHTMDNQISSEPHSFSRIMTGAWYEILCKIYKTEIDAGVQPKLL